MKTTISIHIGKDDRLHTLRKHTNYSNKGINPQYSSRNRYIDNDFKAIVHEKFGKTFNIHEQKTTHKDRKYDNEMNMLKIMTRSNLSKQAVNYADVYGVHGLLIAIGNAKDYSEGIDDVSYQPDRTSDEWFASQAALNNVLDNWNEKHPSLALIYSGLHLDEATPHLHMGVLPNGKEKKIGMSDGQPSIFWKQDKNGFVKSVLNMNQAILDDYYVHTKKLPKDIVRKNKKGKFEWNNRAIFTAWRNEVLEPEILLATKKEYEARHLVFEQEKLDQPTRQFSVPIDDYKTNQYQQSVKQAKQQLRQLKSDLIDQYLSLTGFLEEKYQPSLSKAKLSQESLETIIKAMRLIPNKIVNQHIKAYERELNKQKEAYMPTFTPFLEPDKPKGPRL